MTISRSLRPATQQRATPLSRQWDFCGAVEESEPSLPPGKVSQSKSVNTLVSLRTQPFPLKRQCAVKAHTHTHVHTHARTHSHTRTYTHTRTNTLTHIRTHEHTHSHTHTRPPERTHAHTHRRTHPHGTHTHNTVDQFLVPGRANHIRTIKK